MYLSYYIKNYYTNHILKLKVYIKYFYMDIEIKSIIKEKYLGDASFSMQYVTHMEKVSKTIKMLR